MSATAATQGLLSQTGWQISDLRPIAGDASSRQYFRARMPDAKSVVIMDASNEPGGCTTRFEQIATLLNTSGFSAPRIIAADHAAGLMMIEDFGDALLSRELDRGSLDEAVIYQDLATLTQDLWAVPPPPGFQDLTHSAMIEQAKLFTEWFVGNHPTGNRQHADTLLSSLSEVISARPPEPMGFAHRDFHVENIVWLPDRAGHRRFGLLDFQDALCAPRNYDLASLLTDARRDVPKDISRQILTQHIADAPPASVSYALTATLRSLRILGIFARLCVQDRKPRYAEFMPRVWKHAHEALAQPELAKLKPVFSEACPCPDETVIRAFSEARSA